jgi:hypothetical protein
MGARAAAEAAEAAAADAAARESTHIRALQQAKSDLEYVRLSKRDLELAGSAARYADVC